MSERIDCGVSAISDEDLWARDVERATLRALSALVRRLRSLPGTLERLVCRHRGPQLRRARHGRLYVECMRCGHCSHGIDVTRESI